jgi:DNA-binding CsgD family transcriptional regulator/tetratricopeptide (TPR) repeat protein
LLPRLTARRALGTHSHRIALDPLDVTGTAALVSSMLDGEPLSEEFAAFMHQRTDGVPLAVEESTRVMIERAELRRHGGGWARRSLAEITVSPTIRDAVLERAQRLPGDARAVLQAAAVLASPADEATVRAVAALSAARARAGLSVALGSGLLTEDSRNLIQFRHPLACQALYEAVPGPDARVLHLRAGRVLEKLPQCPAARVARHFREAGDTAKWSQYGEETADLALASGDEATAVAVLHDLLTGASPSAGTAVRLAKQIPFASVNGAQTLQDIVHVLRSILSAGSLDADEEAAVRFQLGRVLMVLREFDTARTEIARAIEHLPASLPEAIHGMTLLGHPRGTLCHNSEHLRWLKRAAETPTPLARAGRLRFLVDMATSLLALGQAAGWAEAAVIPHDAPSGQERQQITRAGLNIGDAAIVWGRYAEARRWLTTALDLAEANGYLRYRDGVLSTRAHLDWLTGVWDGLAERLEALLGDEQLYQGSRREARLVAGLLHAARGAHGQAVEHLQDVLSESRQHGSFDEYIEPAAALARLWLAENRIDDAMLVTDEPCRIVRSKGAWIWATDLAPARIRVLAAAGRVDEAIELAREFAAGLRGGGAPAPRAGLALCRAILAEVRGDYERSAPSFGRAAAAWEALPRPYDALLAREQQASCLLAAGSSQAGLTLLSEVLRGLSRLGATGDADRVAAALRERGVTARRGWRGGRRGYGRQLSPRELEVVRLVLTGQTNPQIARVLSRSPKTVATQLNSAMRKLGVGSRTALAVRAVEAGIVPADTPAAEASLATLPGGEA